MSNQQGKRSQNDPNASRKQGSHQESIQSSEEAQHMGSTDGTRSVQSGVSGIPSQMHVGADRGQKLEDKIDKTLRRDEDQNRPGENAGASGNYGTARSEKGGSRKTDNGSGISHPDRDGSTGSRSHE